MKEINHVGESNCTCDRSQPGYWRSHNPNAGETQGAAEAVDYLNSVAEAEQVVTDIATDSGGHAMAVQQHAAPGGRR